MKDRLNCVTIRTHTSFSPHLLPVVPALDSILRCCAPPVCIPVAPCCMHPDNTISWGVILQSTILSIDLSTPFFILVKTPSRKQRRTPSPLCILPTAATIYLFHPNMAGFHNIIPKLRHAPHGVHLHMSGAAVRAKTMPQCTAIRPGAQNETGRSGYTSRYFMRYTLASIPRLSIFFMSHLRSICSNAAALDTLPPARDRLRSIASFSASWRACFKLTGA